MDKLDLYNLALSMFDLQIDDLSISNKEVRLLDLNYNKVVSFCLKAWDFPFLIKRATLAEYEKDSEGNPVGWNGFKYGYIVPEDFGRAIQIQGSKKHAYSYRFGRLYTNILNPDLEYMPSTLSIDESGEFTHPDDFMALVAYQLALHSAPMLDPDSDAMGNAAQMYQLTLSSIMESETRSNDRPHNHEASPPWDGDVFPTQEDLREAIVRGDI